MKTIAIEQCIEWMDDWQTASEDDREVAAEARAELEAMKAELAAKDEVLEHLKTYFKENHAQKILDPNYLEFHEYNAVLTALKP